MVNPIVFRTARGFVGPAGAGGVTPQVVAAISAALEAYLERPVKVHRIKAEAPGQAASVWVAAGRMELMAARNRWAERKWG